MYWKRVMGVKMTFFFSWGNGNMGVYRGFMGLVACPT